MIGKDEFGNLRLRERRKGGERDVFSPHCSSPGIQISAPTSKNPSVKLLKFANGTTGIGVIKDGDESAYRQEVKELAVWCSYNNIELIILKTVEMIVDLHLLHLHLVI